MRRREVSGDRRHTTKHCSLAAILSPTLSSSLALSSNDVRQCDARQERGLSGDRLQDHVCRGARRSAADARSTLDDRAGICGAAVMVIEDLLAPTNVERLLTKRVQPDTLTRSA